MFGKLFLVECQFFSKNLIINLYKSFFYNENRFSIIKRLCNLQNPVLINFLKKIPSKNYNLIKLLLKKYLIKIAFLKHHPDGSHKCKSQYSHSINIQCNLIYIKLCPKKSCRLALILVRVVFK